MREGFKMNFPRKWKSFEEDLKKCSRSFTQMKFKNFNPGETNSTRVTDLIRVISKEVEVLELISVCFLSQQTFLRFLTSFPKIEELLIINLRVESNKSTVSAASVISPKFLSLENIESINKCKLSCDSKTQNPFIIVAKLKLKKLFLMNASFEILTKINLQSEKIIIIIDELHDPDAPPQNFNDIGNFVGTQQSLTYLGLKCSDERKERLFKCLLLKMNQTTALQDLFVIFEQGDGVCDSKKDIYIKSHNKHISDWKRKIEKQYKGSFVEFLDVMKNSLQCLGIKIRFEDLQDEHIWTTEDFLHDNFLHKLTIENSSDDEPFDDSDDESLQFS